MPIDLYMMPLSAPCRGVLMVAEQLGIELNRKHVDLFVGEQMEPKFVKMNPQHCVPTMDDDGFYLSESRAIMTYLVNKYAPDSDLYPKDPERRAVVDRMLYFDLGMFKAQTEYMFPTFFKALPADAEKLEAFKKTLVFLEEFLTKTPYAAGNHVSLADFSILASLTLAEVVPEFNYDDYPKISAWLKKIKLEVPSNKEINEKPLKEFKEYLISKNYKIM